MSYGNAIRQREESIRVYQEMLLTEANPTRVDDITKQIELCQDEIAQLKIGKPLFGKPTKLNQETRIITADPETKSQKVVVINPHPIEVTEVVEETEESSPTPLVSTRLENDLRKKIQAAKAAKKA